MKHLSSLVVLLFSSSIAFSQAQLDGEPEVLERGANYNLIKSVAEPDEELMAEMNAEEQAEYLASLEEGSYTELASGLNFFEDNQWKPSVAVFENFEEGIVARQGQTKVILSHSLNDPNGSVDLLASDGGRQRSGVWGIAYFDRLTGRSAMIAQRKESRAVLLPPNQVVYLDAFEGDVACDIRYTYLRGSFEQM